MNVTLADSWLAALMCRPRKGQKGRAVNAQPASAVTKCSVRAALTHRMHANAACVGATRPTCSSVCARRAVLIKQSKRNGSWQALHGSLELY